MKLYFLRHAAALDGEDDAQRPLSATGRRQSRKLARALRRAGVRFDLAFSSPLVRARQTADIVLDITNEGLPLRAQVSAALLNDADAETFADWLARLPADAAHVLLVGHEPSLSARVRRLLGLACADALELAKGALACVKTTDHRSGSLKFLLTPKVLGVGHGRQA